ncbi:MAG: selenocysteine-specific translation elongation factor [bacterium]
MSHVIIGTAGHIDHGKTALVQTLTGVDTDRLKEEKERGLTIDLGFAHFGDNATIIDVPGHEKFVRNMVAGVSTIDLVLFVIAADDGVMPQTREHLDILQILQVKHGFVVITKMDLVDEEWLALIEDDVRSLVSDTFLHDAPIFRVSSVSKAGIPQLQKSLIEFITALERQQDKGVFWMPIDRAFTMKGFGTVVTGSVLSGSVQEGETVELLPGKHQTRIRGLQRHGKPVAAVAAGDRAAINLQAIEKARVMRGHVVAAPNYFTASRRFDARLHLLKSAPRALTPRTRVRLHIGTNEVMARISILKEPRVEPGQAAFVQLHLEQPATVRRLDPFVIRQYSPSMTIGGGLILNADAPRRKLSDPGALAELQALEKEDPAEVLESILLAAGHALRTVDHLSSEIATPVETIKQIIHRWQSEGKVVALKKAGKLAVVHQVTYNRLQQHCLDAIAAFHARHPMKLGLPKAELGRLIRPRVDRELLDFLLDRLKQDGRLRESEGLVSLAGHEVTLPAELQNLRDKLERGLYEAGFTTPSEEEMAREFSVPLVRVRELLGALTGLGEVVRVDDSVYFHPKRVEQARETLLDFLRRHEKITISQFKDLLGGASRKYAMPLINYFDRLGITVREGDVRVLGS